MTHGQVTNKTKLNDINWYHDRFSPYIEQHYKGSFVYTPHQVQFEADDAQR